MVQHVCITATGQEIASQPELVKRNISIWHQTALSLGGDTTWTLDSGRHGCYIPSEGLMASTRKAGPTGHQKHDGIPPSRTPGPLGINDQGDPNVCTLQSDTPGPTGIGDFEPPRFLMSGSTPISLMSPADKNERGNLARSAPVIGTGIASVARIRVPGTDYLIEFSPRNFPINKSTSALFIQDEAGRRVLRLDYGYNKRSGQVDYHWNQERTFADCRRMATSSLIRWHSRGLKTQLRDDRKSGGASHSQ